ncbi:hypothetical protein DFH06DRAFT_1397264 [Mycena polygramma]|nr:hypothetical protein DFH06DRAFT_1397264 [Mycena polygramma]
MALAAAAVALLNGVIAAATATAGVGVGAVAGAKSPPPCPVPAVQDFSNQDLRLPFRHGVVPFYPPDLSHQPTGNHVIHMAESNGSSSSSSGPPERRRYGRHRWRSRSRSSGSKSSGSRSSVPEEDQGPNLPGSMPGPGPVFSQPGNVSVAPRGQFGPPGVSLFEKAAEELGRYFDELSNLIREAGEIQEQHRRAIDRDQLIKWYSPLNMLPRHAAIFKNWEPGTGLWLPEHPSFREWKSGTGKILWCQGMPGAGKTVLAHTLRREANAQNIGVGVIYLEHRETDVPTPSSLLAALWRQLVFRKSVSSALEHLYSMHYEPETRPSIEEDDAILRSIIVEYSQVFILVDGLDEYPQEPRDILLRYLGALGSSVNLLLTSRPHITVDHIIPSYEILEIRATEHDIGIYLDSKFTKSFRLSEHIKEHPDLDQKFKTTVVKRSRGMFLLAKLHFESLTKTCTVADAEDALEKMPDNLNRAYDNAVEDRINQQDEGERKLAWRTLSWVTHAKRPLRCSELRDALAVKPGTTDLNPHNRPRKDLVLSVCAGLVVFNEKDEICFIHYTTEEYFRFTFPDAQSDIAITCITYLSFRFEANSPALREPMFLFTDNPFLHYAVDYCLSHAVGPPESDSKLKPLLLVFLSNCSLWRTLWTRKHGEVPLPSNRLSLAAMFHLKATVKNIIEAGADINANSGEALSIASGLGDAELVNLFIESGADVPANGGQALCSALKGNGNAQVIKLLIETGAEVDASDGYVIASTSGSAALVELLIEAGADVEAKNGRALCTVLWGLAGFGWTC